ncbi:hypothetical protein DFJ74DRAFT_675568 [Hyaloraphidium curvatum]|nr:hypothetical protein DFJ74DRAFT_675568 [Hyaloraphidium curvatum]
MGFLPRRLILYGTFAWLSVLLATGSLRLPGGRTESWDALGSAPLRPPPARLGELSVARNVCLHADDPNRPWPSAVSVMDGSDPPPAVTALVGFEPPPLGAGANRSDPVWFPGKTLLPNCEWPSSPQVAHLMFGLGFAMAMAQRWPASAGPKPAFRQIAFSWCPMFKSVYPDNFQDWEFGQHLTEAVVASLELSGMLNTRGAEGGGDSAGSPWSKIVQPKNACYEELWIAHGLRGLLLDVRDEPALLNELGRLVPEAKPHLQLDSAALARGLAERCASKSLRLGVFLREGNWKARRFVNLNAVRDLVQGYTSRPVSTVSTDGHNGTLAHIVAHSSYDALVMPTGSHFAAAVAVPGKQNKAWIEVAPILRDGFWKDEAESWGSVYVLSTGHRMDDAEIDAKIKKQCSWAKLWPNEPEVLQCPLPDEERFALGEGGLHVDLERLARDVERALDQLCHPRKRAPRRRTGRKR